MDRQIGFVTEHYLTLHRLLAADSTADVARNALGVAAATQQVIELADAARQKLPPEAVKALETIRGAALGMTGRDIARDRARFATLSTGLIKLLDHLRPEPQRWPMLYVFHCPMENTDWIQSTEKIANPYHGFKMLDCGWLEKKIENKN